MALYKRLFLVLVLVITASSWYSVHALDGDESVEDGAEDSDDDLFQRNPAYVEPNDNDDSSEEVEEAEEEEAEDAKSALSKALKTSHDAPGRALKALKKHRTKITIVLAMYAFRREIWQAVLHIFGTSQVDPETGETLGQSLEIKPTTLLKIIIFIDVMRRLQSNDGATQSAIPLAAFMLGGSQATLLSQAISMFLKKNSNPSYVPPIEQHYTFERINERYMKDGWALQKAMQPAKQQSSLRPPRLGNSSSSIFGSSFSTEQQQQHKLAYNGTVILFDMTGLDTGVSKNRELSDKVSFLLESHRAKQTSLTTERTADTKPKSQTSSDDDETVNAELEIIITLESPGGSASEYGALAQQMLRLRNEPGIKVTVCVDKVAASGGYMCACTSSPGRLYAAPFAVVGSIGVIGQTLNVHNALEKWGVKPLVFRGGKHKSPLGMIGEVTDDAIATVQGMVDKTHDAFKRHVLTSRPLVAHHLEDVATGEVWLGCDALEVGLVDRVVTSDEYIGERLRDGARVLKLVNYRKERFPFGHHGDHRTLASLTSYIPNRLMELRKFTSKMSHVLNELVAGSYEGFKVPSSPSSLGVSDMSPMGL